MQLRYWSIVHQAAASGRQLPAPCLIGSSLPLCPSTSALSLHLFYRSVHQQPISDFIDSIPFSTDLLLLFCHRPAQLTWPIMPVFHTKTIESILEPVAQQVSFFRHYYNL